MKAMAYVKLMRFDKPVGIGLLWFPTAWALWTANKGLPSLYLLALFFCGTAIMRAAGCVINDLADRNIDKFVARTKLRPVTSGVISIPQALITLAVLLFLAFFILLMLPRECFPLALLAVLITGVYPFCKRFIKGPQLVLGLAFSIGMPMAYVASGIPYSKELAELMLINFLWIVSYDTMYAIADKADDLHIGVKSTALWFGNYDRHIIAVLQITFHTLWLFWAMQKGAGPGFYILWGCAALILAYQQYLITQRNPKDCIKAFTSNSNYGFCMWIAVMLAS